MILEILRLLWPFLKEFFLGKETSLGGAVRKREYKRVLALLLVTCSIAVNLYLIPKLIILSDDLMHLRREKVALTEENQRCVPPKTITGPVAVDVIQKPDPTPAPPEQPSAPPPTPASTPSVADDHYQRRYTNLLNRMSELQSR